MSTYFLALYDLSANWQLVTGKTQSFMSDFFRNAPYFEHNLAALNWGNPAFWSTFTITHPDTNTLAGVGKLREDLDPNLPTTLHVTGNSDTGSFDLTVADPMRIKGLQTVVTKGNSLATLSFTTHVTTLNLTVLYSLWY